GRQPAMSAVMDRARGRHILARIVLGRPASRRPILFPAMTERPWVRHYPDAVPVSLRPSPAGSLYSMLEDSARRHPEAPAIAFFGRRLSYRQLLEEVERASGALARLGVKPGDRVGLILPNCPEYVIAYYATLRLGAIVVGTNPLYTERELQHQLQDAGVKVPVVLESPYPKLAVIRDAAGLAEVVVTRITHYMPFPTSLLAWLRLTWQAIARGGPWRPVPRGARVHRWRAVTGPPARA